MDEARSKVSASLQAVHASIHCKPTEETIADALKSVEAVGHDFQNCEEVFLAAEVLARRDMITTDIKSPMCSDDPSMCVVMGYVETFLAEMPGKIYSIKLPLRDEVAPLRDEVLRRVRPWRSSTSACNPCPYSSAVVQRGLDPYMMEEDQKRAAELAFACARASE